MITSPVPPSIVITSPSRTLVAADRRGLAPATSIESVLAAGDARLAHPARDDGRVGGHAAVRGEDPVRLDHAVDVVRRRLPADEDHVLARLAALLGGVGVEHDLAGGRARARRSGPLRATS